MTGSMAIKEKRTHWWCLLLCLVMLALSLVRTLEYHHSHEHLDGDVCHICTIIDYVHSQAQSLTPPSGDILAFIFAAGFLLTAAFIFELNLKKATLVSLCVKKSE